MKHYIMALGFFVLLGCVGGVAPVTPVAVVPTTQPVSQQPTTQQLQNSNNSDFTLFEEDRSVPVPRDNRRSRSVDCEGDRTCEGMCDDIFDSSRYRKECYELSEDDVEDMLDSYKLLKSPDEDDLDELDIDSLSAIHDIDDDVLKELIEDFSSNETEDFLVWLYEDDEAQEEVRDFFFNDVGRDDYEILNILLKNMDSNVIRAFNENIDGSDSFLEYLLDEAEEDLIEETIHEFFTEGSQDTSNEDCDAKSSSAETNKCIFTKYCIARFNTQAKKDLFDVEFFEDFMEDLLSSSDFEKLRNMDGDYQEFCGGLGANSGTRSTSSSTSTSTSNGGSSCTLSDIKESAIVFKVKTPTIKICKKTSSNEYDCGAGPINIAQLAGAGSEYKYNKSELLNQNPEITGTEDLTLHFSDRTLLNADIRRVVIFTSKIREGNIKKLSNRVVLKKGSNISITGNSVKLTGIKGSALTNDDILGITFVVKQNGVCTTHSQVR